MTLRDRWSAARAAWSDKSAPGRSGRPTAKSRDGRRPARPTADWRITATTLAGIVSVLLVAAGLFYTNQANREQQKLGIQQQELNLQ